MSHENEALETAVSFLKTLADHALGEERKQTQGVRERAVAWTRHLAIGAPHPENTENSKPQTRDFAGARRFVSRTLRDGHAVQIRTEQQFRDTAWGFAAELHELVRADAADDQSIQASMKMLRAAVDGEDVDTLRAATAKVSRDLFHLLESRERARRDSVSRATSRLSDLLDVLQRDSSLSIDPVTGLLDRRGLSDAAERIHVLSGLANAPVSVALLSVSGTQLKLDAANELMASLAKPLSRAFLSRNDILGREGDACFAVISVGSDAPATRSATVRARELLLTAGKSSGAHMASLELTVGVAPLSLPFGSAVQQARAL